VGFSAPPAHTGDPAVLRQLESEVLALRWSSGTPVTFDTVTEVIVEKNAYGEWVLE
jgi:hypothetical protein